MDLDPGTLLRHIWQSHCILALEHEIAWDSMRMNLLSESQGKDRHDANFHTSKFQLNCLRIDLEEQPPSEPLTQGFKNKSTILPHKFTSIAEGSAILSMCALVLAHSRKSAKKSSRIFRFCQLKSYFRWGFSVQDRTLGDLKSTPRSEGQTFCMAARTKAWS